MAKRTGGAVLRTVRSVLDDADATDRELLTRYSEGDESAFTALVSRHGGMVLGVCRRVLPTVQDAEDATQAVFLVLSRKTSVCRWQPSIANWLYTAARQIASRANRSAKRRVKRETRTTQPSPSTLDQMTGREAFAALDTELDRLPPIYREALVLCYLEGLSREEAAARLGLPAATMKMRLERGRKRLADALTKRGIVLGAGLLAVAATSPAGASPSALIASVLAAVNGSPSQTAVALARGATVNGFLTRTKMLAMVGLVAVGFGLAAVPAGAGPQSPKPTQDKMEKPKTEGKGEAKPTEAKVTVRVVDSDGKPVVDATVYRRVDPNGRGRPVETAVGKTNAVGELDCDRPPFARFHAVARGYPAAACNGQTDATALVIRLAKPLPIRGRLVNLQGKPIPNAKVVVESVSAAENDDLTAGYEACRVNQDLMHHALPITLDGRATGAPSGATTDADGRFELPGVGRMRVAHLRFEADAVEVARVTVFADPEFAKRMKLPTDAETKQSQLNGHFREPTFGPEFTHTARPEHVITGTVTDGTTGKPVAGVTVAGTTSDLGNRFLSRSWHDKVETKTDSDGKFRLTGLAKADKRFLHVAGTDTAPYLDSAVEVADIAGYTPVTADMKLQPAVVVRGRLVNKATGKPVSGVAFWYALNGDDQKRIGGDIYFNHTHTSPSGTIADAGADGRFVLRIPPGPGVILTQADQRDLTTAFTPVRVRDEDRKYLRKPADKPAATGDTPQPREGEEFFDVTNYRVPLRGQNGYAIVTPDAKARSCDVMIEFDPGATVTLNAVDPEGKPLGGVTAVGPGGYAQRPTTFATPEITIGGVDPKGRPVQLYLLHGDRNLCAAVTLKGDERGAVAVKMQPCGRVTGRVVDHTGKPVKDAQVRFYMTDAVADELIRTRLYRWSEETRADAEGKFSFPQMFPDVKFLLAVNLPGHRAWAAEPVRVTLKPGEAKDVGEFKCRDPKQRDE